ncbi:MAG: hypothetical protein MI862_08185 [Desulfobacterales bacterium]|nr:hypothetical protein [Desulfobacterales bacterium]
MSLILLGLGFVLNYFNKRNIAISDDKQKQAINKNLKFALYMLIISLLRIGRRVSSGADLIEILPGTIVFFIAGLLILVAYGIVVNFYNKRKAAKADDNKLQ